jgi:hypothetical protein
MWLCVRQNPLVEHLWLESSTSPPVSHGNVETIRRDIIGPELYAQNWQICETAIYQAKIDAPISANHHVGR